MMKNKMLIINFILALLLVPVANSCDPDACRIGTSAGAGACAVGTGVAGVVSASACAAGAIITFGLSCLAAAVTFTAVGSTCAAVGGVVGNACSLCASDDAPNYAKNFQELAKNFQQLDKNDKTIIQNQLDNHLKQEKWFQQLVQNDKNIIQTQLENRFEQKMWFQQLAENDQYIANQLVGIEQNQVENLLQQEAWFQQLIKNNENILQNQVENHLKHEAWFQQLVENDKNIILRQGKMIALQQTTMGQLDQLITTTETLGNKIEHSEIVSLYGQDIKRVGNVRNKFKLLTRGTSGVIVNDHRAKVFRDAALHPVDGLESSISNIFLMLQGGHILKRESLYEISGDKYCKPEVRQYFVNVLVEALTMHATALAMDGHTLPPQLTRNFNANIVKATSAYVQHCDCLPGFKKENRGLVSTLLDQLPRSSQNVIQNRGQVARMDNSVMRIKMDTIFAVKNFDPNNIAERILENYSVEDIELVATLVMNEKEDELEFHDSADVCIDEERNKVKTCAAFTPNSLINGCVPPQTLEHGRFLCLEDGVTCHAVCDKGYVHENTDKAHMLMECLDNTWTPAPTTFKCLVSCSGGATLLSTSPRHDMVLCKDETQQTCEKDFESLCPAGWNLCTPKQFNNRNHGWDYNWVQAGDGNPLGVIYCHGGRGYASHYIIHNSNPVLNTDEQLNCWRSSSRPGCEHYAGKGWDCDDKDKSALCCAPSTTCGDGLVQEEEEDCDDGNKDNMDECLDTCTWKIPRKHGISGC